MGNIHIVTGFIDSDVNVKHVGTPTKKVAEFSVNDGFGWVRCVAWEAVADKVPPKGSHVIVHGRTQTRSYDKDGQKHYATETNVSMIEQVGVETRSPSPADDFLGD